VPISRASLLLAAVTAAGALLGLQGRINGALGEHLHSSIAAATVSFVVGTVLLAGYVVARQRPAVTALRPGNIAWWWWLGGLAGAAVVASTAQGVPEIGVALVTVSVVAGTTTGALAVDQIGLGPGGRQPASVMRVAGATLAVVAVGLGVLGDRHAAVRPALFAALFLAGAASAFQQAANGQVRVVANSTAVASLVSFTGGTIALVVTSLARGDLTGIAWPGQWWLYVGGSLGAVYIALAATAVGEVGVLRLSLATVAGQLVAAVLLDVAWPAPGIHLRVQTVVGALLTLAAVGVTGLGRRQTPTGTTT
jgi:bacterial/archaeal transporter family-2 protein